MRCFLFAPLLALPSALMAQADPQPCTDALLFASDTQGPMRVERIYLRGDSNVQATQALFRDIMMQRPTEVFLLGDVVDLGFRHSHWAFIDTALAEARRKGFNMNAILGNHELMFRSARGERNFQQRFTQHERTGYVVRKDSMAVVLLNSNFNKLSRADITTQDAWYTATLDSLDNDPGVRVVLVCCHHSPYSDSKLVGSNPAVQAHFVEPFLHAAKTRVFLSGHAHLFQHFRKQGRDFFVIGGGGGLHHPMSRRPGVETSLDADYSPLFHYLTVQRCATELKVVSRRLKADRSGFEEGRVYHLDLPEERATGE